MICRIWFESMSRGKLFKYNEASRIGCILPRLIRPQYHPRHEVFPYNKQLASRFICLSGCIHMFPIINFMAAAYEPQLHLYRRPSEYFLDQREATLTLFRIPARYFVYSGCIITLLHGMNMISHIFYLV